MSEKVLVGGSLRKWDAQLAIVAAVVCGGATIVFAREMPAGVRITLDVIALVLFTIGAVTLRRRYAKRVWAVDTAGGLDLLDPSGNHLTATIPDEEVGSVAVSTEPVLGVQGDKVVGLLRRMRLRTLADDGQVRVFSLETQFPPERADPLGPYVERILDRLAEAAKGVLARGGTLPGDGWQLTAKELKIGESARPLGGLQSASVLDKHVCVWFGDDERPTLRVKEDGWNAWLLLMLLGERLQNVPSRDKPLEHLGRILYERKATRKEYVLASFLSLAVIVFPLLGFLDRNLDRTTYLILPAISALGVGVLVFWLAYLRSSVFRCHEGGVYRKTMFKERRLMFRDAIAFTYAATRMYVNGGYAGTQIAFDLEPASGREEEHVVYGANVKNADEMFETLREHIAGVIGVRMAEFVSAGERVTWTPTVAFHGDRLLFTTGGLIRAKTEHSVPIDEVTNYRMNNGVLELLTASDTKPLVTINSHERNFFPGFVCLTILVGEATSLAPGESSLE
jgi:nitrate reductase NapE component